MVLVRTEDLVQKGASGPKLAIGSDKEITTEPREILFVARPYTFFEKLFAPLLRE
jgi:hypothetical protein